MVFIQGMEISVLLHVTDFLDSWWASSLISKAMRPIASQRCITSVFPGGTGQALARFGLLLCSST